VLPANPLQAHGLGHDPQVDEYRARFPCPGGPERFLHDTRKVGGTGQAPGGLGDGSADYGDIHTLEGILPQQGRGPLPREGDQGHGIDVGRVQAGDEIDRAGARGASHVVLDEVRQPQKLIHGVDASARNAEGIADALKLKNFDHNLCSFQDYRGRTDCIQYSFQDPQAPEALS
jgi:hypothetical protein